MREAIEDEIYEIEEMIASLSSHDQNGTNAVIIAELNLYLMRLKEKFNHCEELDNATRPLSVGGEISSKDD